MIKLLSKVRYILKEEGILSLGIRATRYIVTISWRAFRNNKDVIESWETIKGKYKGRRAFLLGNGPSLNDTELYLLKDEFVICFNRFNLMLERLDFTPSAYAVADDRVLLDNIDDINDFKDQFEYAFFPDIHISAPIFTNYKRKIKPGKNTFWFFADKAGFVDNLPYCGMNKTVTNVAIQILHYMGFEEIYLLGLDHDYGIPANSKIRNKRDIQASENNDSNHFDPRYFGTNKKYHVPHLEETEEKYKEALSFSNMNNFKIYNSTLGGKLEVFERVDFDKVLNFSEKEKRSRFKENIENCLQIDFDLEIPLGQMDSGDEYENDEYIIIEKSKVKNKLIEVIDTHIPYGPYNGYYLLLNRSIVNRNG